VSAAVFQSPSLLHLLLSAERGGCERCCAMLIDHLPGARHTVFVLGPDGPMTAVFRSGGAEVEVVPAAEIRGGARLIAAVRRRVQTNRPAAAVAWHGLPQLPQLLTALKGGVANVGVYGGNPAHTMPRWVDWKFVLLGLRYPAPIPTYLCCSQYVADSFEASRYLRRLPRVVVYNGVPVPERGPHVPRAFDSDKPTVVGMLARLDVMKDHGTLIRAFALLRKSLPNARLELAGGGDQRGPLEALAASLGIAGAVKFWGDVADVYGVMSRWDAVGYATTEREGLGSALIEGMMLGLPVVATDVGPIREVCGRPGTGVLVPPHDPAALAAALARLLPDLEMRQKLSVAGRATAVELFHPATFARRYAEVLRLPLPGRGAP